MMGSEAGGRSVDRDHRARFLEILAHELRTPVTTIFGGAELLVRADLPSGRAQDLAEDIRSEADRLYRLTEDLLVLSRSERDGLRPIGEPVALSRLVREAVGRESGRGQHPSIRVHGDPDAVVERADEGLMRHVIRNLLDNAIHNGAQAGPIDIVIESDREAVVRFFDQGPLPRPGSDSFDYGADPPVTAAARAGAGIGLHVADRLVRAMGGRVWASGSGLQGRAEFGFALPAFADVASPRA